MKCSSCGGLINKKDTWAWAFVEHYVRGKTMTKRTVRSCEKCLAVSDIVIVRSAESTTTHAPHAP